MIVLLDKSGSLAVDLAGIGSQVLIGAGPSISSVTTANGGQATKRTVGDGHALCGVGVGSVPRGRSAGVILYQ